MNSIFVSKYNCLFGNNIFLQPRLFSTTNISHLIQKWRKEKGLPMNPNAYGPLTDKPDYTFSDGRPTPLGMRQSKRLQKQRELTLRVIQLSKEMDYAVERHNAELKAEEDRKNRILSNKLKPKGHLLLKKTN